MKNEEKTMLCVCVGFFLNSSAHHEKSSLDFCFKCHLVYSNRSGCIMFSVCFFF